MEQCRVPKEKEIESIRAKALDHWEEVQGKLLAIDILEGRLIITLSKTYYVEFENDADLAGKLKRLINKHVGILRTDEDYRIRVMK